MQTQFLLASSSCLSVAQMETCSFSYEATTTFDIYTIAGTSTDPEIAEIKDIYVLATGLIFFLAVFMFYVFYFKRREKHLV